MAEPRASKSGAGKSGASKSGASKSGASKSGAGKHAGQRTSLASSASLFAPSERVVVAIPKGRVLSALAKRLAPLGVDRDVLLADDRTLVRDDPCTGLRFLLLKPDDVPTYVEYGTADLGIVGRDILMEREYDVYAPIDLGIGVCRMVVAGKDDELPRGRTLRVATKFANIATRHFASKGQNVDIVYVQGSVELAPITGLSDVIVDLVESGETLRQNGLRELEWVCSISSVVIANRVALKLKRARIAPLLEALRPA